MGITLQVIEEEKRSKLVLKSGKRRRTLLISSDFQHLVTVKHALNPGLSSGRVEFTIIHETLTPVPGVDIPMWYGSVNGIHIFATNVSRECIIKLIDKMEEKLSGICVVIIKGEIK